MLMGRFFNLQEIDDADLENKIKKTKSITSLPKKYKIPEHLLIKYADKFCWETVSTYQVLSKEFIGKNLDRLFMCFVVINNHIEESFIDDNIDVLGKDKNFWHNLVRVQMLSEPFMERYIGKINWNEAWDKQIFTSEFLIKHSNMLTDYDVDLRLKNNTNIDQESITPFYVMWQLLK